MRNSVLQLNFPRIFPGIPAFDWLSRTWLSCTHGRSKWQALIGCKSGLVFDGFKSPPPIDIARRYAGGSPP